MKAAIIAIVGSDRFKILELPSDDNYTAKNYTFEQKIISRMDLIRGVLTGHIKLINGDVDSKDGRLVVTGKGVSLDRYTHLDNEGIVDTNYGNS